MSSLRTQAAPSSDALTRHLPFLSEYTWLSWGETVPMRWPLPRDCLFCCPSLNYCLFSASFTLCYDFLDVSAYQLFQGLVVKNEGRRKSNWKTTKSCLFSMAPLPSLASGVGIFVCMERYCGLVEAGSLQHIPELQTEPRLT